MPTHLSVRQAVRLALLMGAVPVGFSASNAFAQDQQAPTADSEEIEVVVTGSRIRQANLETTSPVTQVTAADISTAGVTRVEDLVTQLPQAFAAQNSTVSNGATGTATVSLRGLGSARTLVLVDGRRMPYAGVNESAADLNQIPTQMVERVEVLTGGASAAYGSDAIAGVVNFIMKKNFEGVELSGQYGFYQHNNGFGGPGAVSLRERIAQRAATNPSQFALPDDNVTDGYGKEINLTIGVGTDDGRGNITIYGGFRDNDPVLQRDRDYSACSLGANPTVSFACGGSGTAFPGTFTQDFVTNFTVDSAGAGNTFRPFNSALDQYNFGPLNYYQRPDRRYNLGAFGAYEFNEKAEVYTQLMYTNYESIAQIAPGGAFFDTSSINCGNPLLSAQQLSTIGCSAAEITADSSETLYIGRRNVEGGGRQQSFTNSTFRGVVGLRGSLSEAWDYDASAQFAQLNADQQTLNYFVIDRLERALDVVDTDPSPTVVNAQCRSVVNGSDPLCVPYNPFRIGGVTQEALDYLQAPGIQTATIKQDVFQASFQGDLGAYGVKLPTADTGVQVAVGAEYRRDKLTNTTDALLSSAALSGTGGATIGITGSTKVTDLFVETRIPLVEDKTFFNKLGLELAYRFSDYGDSLTTDTYKIGLDWAPVEDIRFRGSYQRAVRAANIIELFTAQGFNLFDLDGDPCGAADRNPNATAAECIATGVPAANVGSVALDSPAGQYNFQQGGNPNLNPEESDTVTFGFVFTPSFVPNLSLSVDYFDIEVEGLVATFGAENTLDACYNNGDAAACGRIRRNANGQLWVGDGNVIDTNINIGSLQTSGIDILANYSKLEIGNAGSLSFNLISTYLKELITNPGPGIDPYDCAGFFGSNCVTGGPGTPAPKWRHQARIGWQTPWNLDVSLTGRHYSKAELFNGAANRIDRVLSAETYVDLFGSYQVTDKAQVRLGVNNVLDNDPSLSASVGTTGNGNTYPQVYDALGRFIFAGVTVKF
jgi:iron complex outermembrane recepter protein